MDLNFLILKIQAQVQEKKEQFESVYERLSDHQLFWGMIDLANSSNYRIEYGPKKGYIRGTMFFSMIDHVLEPCKEVRRIKEIGDAVLLVATDPRILFESFILIDRIASQISQMSSPETYPFAIRGAINSGIAKRLQRPREDYLGTPIDQLSRICSIKSQTAHLFIQEETFLSTKDILDEYNSLVQFSPSPIQMPHIMTKGMLKDIYYRELFVDDSGIDKFRTNFRPWRSKLASSSHDELLEDHP